MTLRGTDLNMHYAIERNEDNWQAGNRLFAAPASIELEPGIITLCYGPSGSGKSTLFNILSGLILPSEGNVFWGDAAITTTEQANRIRSRHLSLIFSNFYFLESMNVRENIVLPAVFARYPAAQIAKRLDTLLQVFSFAGVEGSGLLHLPSLIDRKMKTLSNGQKEIVAMCRGLMLDVDFIFADEMLRSFNQTAETAVWHRFSGLLKEENRSLFFITHKEHLKSGENVDRVYTISGGTLEQTR